MPTSQPTHDEVITATADTEATMRVQCVPVNAYETTGALVVVAPFPAVASEDVTVELEEGVLRFWASLRSAGPRSYLLHEWEYGGYEREVDLPSGFGRDLEASLANGQLVVRVLRGTFESSRRIKPVAL